MCAGRDAWVLVGRGLLQLRFPCSVCQTRLETEQKQKHRGKTGGFQRFRGKTAQQVGVPRLYKQNKYSLISTGALAPTTFSTFPVLI